MVSQHKAARARKSIRLGAVIRQLREARGWSQGQLAERCATSRSNVSKIERGDEQGYGIELLEALSKALGFETYQLFAMAAGVDLRATESLRLDEKELLANYRSLTPQQREMLHSVSQTLRRPKSR